MLALPVSPFQLSYLPRMWDSVRSPMAHQFLCRAEPPWINRVYLSFLQTHVPSLGKTPEEVANLFGILLTFHHLLVTSPGGPVPQQILGGISCRESPQASPPHPHSSPFLSRKSYRNTGPWGLEGGAGTLETEAGLLPPWEQRRTCTVQIGGWGSKHSLSSCSGKREHSGKGKAKGRCCSSNTFGLGSPGIGA